MAGYIGSAASVVSSGAENKKTFTITGATTSLTGCNYTVGKVHVFQNGVRLVDGTDYTATNGTTVTLTVAAQSGDNVVVISQASYQVADAVLTSGDSMTGDLSFGDSDKAIFGAGDDLQIYHDGSNSIIHDNGTGNLQIRAGNLNILNAAATENYLSADNNGAVNLFYDNSKKIETTSTGIAVTGSTAHTAGDITNTISGTYNLNGANGTAGSAAYVTYSFKDDVNTGMYRGGADTLSFATGGTERMRLDSSGHFLLGNTSYATTPASGVTIQRGDNASVNLGHTSSPSGYLFVNFGYNGGQIGSITQSGTTGVSYNTSSDYRLKENVVDLTGASARVNQLDVKRFNFIADDTNTLVDGFLAHEVATVVPEAINGTKDAMMDEEYEVTPAVLDDDGNVTTEAVMGTRSVPDYQGIDQSKLVPLLTAALQEALTEIASLKTRVEALEA